SSSCVRRSSSPCTVYRTQTHPHSCRTRRSSDLGLSRKRKGSANRAKARKKVARVHARITDRRQDFLHKLTTRLVRENQVVVSLRSEEHTSELQSRFDLVCRLLLDIKNATTIV